MDVTLISHMFEGLPRQGPGTDEATAFAGSFIPPDRRRGKILDIGCGSGMQTLTLARIFPDCRITATDLYQPFLDELTRRSEEAGLGERIQTMETSMDNLPFGEGAYDIIWAEGSAFIIGIEPALRYWKKFLKPDGYLVFSDCLWYTSTPSEECREFMNDISPGMPSEAGADEIIRKNGYAKVGSFRLPDIGWWTHYYHPLQDRIGSLKEKYAGNNDAQMIIQGLETEMEIHRKYSSEYGYTYFILRLSPSNPHSDMKKAG